MKLKILGCGEAFDAHHGNNACILYDKSASAPTLLLDCGYQIPERLWREEKLWKNLDGIAFTHLHADHAFGIVPLLVRAQEDGRKKPLHLLGTRGLERYVERLLEIGYPGIAKRITYERVFHVLEPGKPYPWKGLTLHSARTEHSVLNLSLRIELANGKSFAVSGDGNFTPATRRLFEGVDLLLHEMYSLKPGVPVHADLESFVPYAMNARIGRIGLAHLARGERDRIEKAVAKLKKTDPRWFIARVGQVIDL